MAEVTIQQAFDLAVQHQNAGRLQDAEQIYRQILAVQPQHSDSIQMLGVLAHTVGRNDVAVDLIRRALTLDPSFGEAYSNLGNALLQLGEIDQAINAYRQAIALRPRFAPARTNLGHALTCNGQFAEAVVSCREAVSLDPNIPESHNNLGNALTRSGKKKEAVASYRNAIRLRTAFPEAHFNLGLALLETGRLDESIAEYRHAIALRPNYPEAYNNLGNALKDHQQLDDAIASYRQAITWHPDFADARNNLGNALTDAGQLDEAVAAYRLAMAIAMGPEKSWIHSNLIYTLYFHPGFDAPAIAGQLGDWNRQHAEPLRKFIAPHPNDRNPDRRIRIGYVSPDLRENVVGYNLLPLFRNCDRGQFEVTAYADVAGPDAITREFEKQSDRWRNIAGLSDEKVAAQIREDQIDILVDLSLHMAHNHLPLFARKPAPVQFTFAGYPASTGLDAIDYRLSDPYLDPPGMDESIYTEKTIRLPDSFWCYDPLDCRDVPINPLPALSAVEGGASNEPAEPNVVTFGCLSYFGKINDGALVLWAQVMKQVEGSRLLLLAPEGSHRDRTRDRLAREGVEPGRVEFVLRRPRRQYLELYHRIDVGLDCFPYNGHTTSLESLWMGVPVVTLVGQTAVSRAGWCQLSNLGLTELAANTPEQFVRIAVELARDLPRLKELRAGLRSRMEQSPLMDAPKFAGNIEAACRQMWRTWCESGPAERAESHPSGISGTAST